MKMTAMGPDDFVMLMSHWRFASLHWRD